MPCFHPLAGVNVGINEKTGKKVIKVLKGSEVTDWQRKQEPIIPLPCGRCIGCRLERSRQWASRCVHEASIHPKNCFITLTFREACPLDKYRTDPTVSLHKFHFQNFMKRLREQFPDEKIRYFHCGEYGELCLHCRKPERLCRKEGCGKFESDLGRPHHHACLFNFDFKDKEVLKVKDGVTLYTSKTLEKLWPYGWCTIGAVTFESAAYVARYCVKKINGVMADEHYKGRLPEYTTMSRGGRKKGSHGIAAEWFDKYKDDVYPKDFIVIRGKKSKVPKYYDRRLELTNPEEFASVSNMRKLSALNNPDNCKARLIAAEVIKKSQVKTLIRPLDDSSDSVPYVN